MPQNQQKQYICRLIWKEGNPRRTSNCIYCPNQHCDRESIGHLSVSALRKIFMMEKQSGEPNQRPKRETSPLSSVSCKSMFCLDPGSQERKINQVRDCDCDGL